MQEIKNFTLKWREDILMMTDSVSGLNGPYVYLSTEIARQNLLNQSIQTSLCCESKRSLQFALSS